MRFLGGFVGGGSKLHPSRWACTVVTLVEKEAKTVLALALMEREVVGIGIETGEEDMDVDTTIPIGFVVTKVVSSTRGTTGVGEKLLCVHLDHLSASTMLYS
jgi:hypothetical protein